MIALLAALDAELADLRRQLKPEEPLGGPACRLYSGEYQGRAVVLAQMGMGRERAEAATRLVLDRYPVTTVVSFGFAGALAAQLRVGDIVLCSMLQCATGPTPGTTGAGFHRSDDRLLGLATQALQSRGMRSCMGSSVTVPRLVCSPQDKADLAKAFRSQIVDMESYWIAGIASDEQIPFVSLRAISDTLRDPLPPFDRMLTPAGRWRWKEAASFFLCCPQHLFMLIDLARNARQARTNLTAALGCVVAAL